jgi:hypothetical protein
MRLLKLEYPKRRLAVTPEQLMAIETLYEPYLPLPPLGIHKIIAKQLRLDEWRVHVAIGLIRKNRNLNRWNEDREDLPPEMREAQKKAHEEKERLRAEKLAAEAEARKAAAAAAKAAEAEGEAATPAEEPAKEEAAVVPEKKPTRSRKVAAVAATESAESADDEAGLLLEIPSEDETSPRRVAKEQ